MARFFSIRRFVNLLEKKVEVRPISAKKAEKDALWRKRILYVTPRVLRSPVPTQKGVVFSKIGQAKSLQELIEKGGLGKIDLALEQARGEMIMLSKFPSAALEILSYISRIELPSQRHTRRFEYSPSITSGANLYLLGGFSVGSVDRTEYDPVFDLKMIARRWLPVKLRSKALTRLAMAYGRDKALRIRDLLRDYWKQDPVRRVEIIQDIKALIGFTDYYEQNRDAEAIDLSLPSLEAEKPSGGADFGEEKIDERVVEESERRKKLAEQKHNDELTESLDNALQGKEDEETVITEEFGAEESKEESKDSYAELPEINAADMADALEDLAQQDNEIGRAVRGGLQAGNAMRDVRFARYVCTVPQELVRTYRRILLTHRRWFVPRQTSGLLDCNRLVDAALGKTNRVFKRRATAAEGGVLRSRIFVIVDVSGSLDEFAETLLSHAVAMGLAARELKADVKIVLFAAGAEMINPKELEYDPTTGVVTASNFPHIDSGATRFYLAQELVLKQLAPRDSVIVFSDGHFNSGYVEVLRKLSETAPSIVRTDEATRSSLPLLSRAVFAYVSSDSEEDEIVEQFEAFAKLLAHQRGRPVVGECNCN